MIESQLWKIGEVAQKSNLPIKTIRYYANIGLLSEEMMRNSSGYRLFKPSVINRLSFIKRSQSLGLTLKEIQAILAVYNQGKIPCGVAKKLLIDKLEQIEEKISKLLILQSELQGILSGWQDIPSPEMLNESICPNLTPN